MRWMSSVCQREKNRAKATDVEASNPTMSFAMAKMEEHHGCGIWLRAHDFVMRPRMRAGMRAPNNESRCRAGHCKGGARVCASDGEPPAWS